MDEVLLRYWKDNEGAFACVDYISEGEKRAAKGRLESVSPVGQVIIRHLNDPKISWCFNIFKVEIVTSRFSPVREEEE